MLYHHINYVIIKTHILHTETTRQVLYQYFNCSIIKQTDMIKMILMIKFLTIYIWVVLSSLRACPGCPGPAWCWWRCPAARWPCPATRRGGSQPRAARQPAPPRSWRGSSCSRPRRCRGAPRRGTWTAASWHDITSIRGSRCKSALNASAEIAFEDFVSLVRNCNWRVKGHSSIHGIARSVSTCPPPPRMCGGRRAARPGSCRAGGSSARGSPPCRRAARPPAPTPPGPPPAGTGLVSMY